MKTRYGTGWLIGLVLIGLVSTAFAEEDEDEEGRFTANNARWKAECGSCHTAFPPQLLSARDWGQIMSKLDKHYGSDASLEPAVTTEIRKFLEGNSGRRSGASAKAGELPRITQSSWFAREHREVPARLWKSKAVNTAANCAACHRGADKGDYSEDSVQLPK
jgi:nitrate/TMAO reductase-like tetraheme cytochrome c subunit